MSGPASGPALRVGQGFDVHRFSDDWARRLVLGGVVVPGAPGLAGHSDADVLCHALADALLGGAGLGDIGRHFPDSDSRFEGADSTDLLGQVTSLVQGEGWRVLNADCTVVCELPRLAGHLDDMSRRLSEVLGAPVGVKATGAEGMGALGRAEGIACLAVALLAPSS